LWISDLHFGENHGFPTGDDVTKKQIWDALYSACRKHNINPAGVIASGDFTWGGKADPFKDAKTFLSKLTSVLGLRERDVLMVPGNHDIPRKPDSGGTIRAISKEDTEAYRTFYANFYRTEPNEFLSVGRRFVLGNTLPRHFQWNCSPQSARRRIHFLKKRCFWGRRPNSLGFKHLQRSFYSTESVEEPEIRIR